MKKKIWTGLILLVILPALLITGCQKETETTKITPDPFTTTWSPVGEGWSLSISGNSAGHEAGKPSEFTLKLDNADGSGPWIGSYCLLLLDRDGIVMEIAHNQFNVPAGLAPETAVPVNFPENLEGPYGLSLIIPDRAQAITTIWIGAGRTANAGPWPEITTCPYYLTEEGSRELAGVFVKNSPTFVFDGMGETLELVETLYPDIENAWQFVYRFESRHGGYGDRTGQMLIEVITPHEAIITIEQGKVTNAVMDGKWDMMKQRMLDSQTPEEAARQVAEEFVVHSPTFTFDGIIGSLELIETRRFDVTGYWLWEFVFRFLSANAGYGDRTGQGVAEVETFHTSVITVENGEVKSAIMDGKWDMMNQRMLDSEELTIEFNFRESDEGWVGEFVDLPADYEQDLYNLQFDRVDLPESLNMSGKGLMLSGRNASDDLFMYLKKQLGSADGLKPGTVYLVRFEIDLATSAPSGAVGIGGPPGEAVWVKVGAASTEPAPVAVDEGGPYYRLSVDKGSQNNDGANAVRVGDVAKQYSDDFDTYEIKTLNNSGSPLEVTTDENGNLWVFIGTDSGFEGTTTLYYTGIKVTLEEK